MPAADRTAQQQWGVVPIEAFDADCPGLFNTPLFGFGQVAQLVEQRTENPRVGGSIPSLATIS